MAAGVNGLGDVNLEKLWSVALQPRIGPRVFLALNRMAAIPISTFMIFPRRMASVVVERGLALLRVYTRANQGLVFLQPSSTRRADGFR